MEKVQTRGPVATIVLIGAFLLVSVHGAKDPPKLLSREVRPLQVVKLGQEFKITCPIEAEPAPIVDWYKDGEPINPTWQRFRITNRGLRIRPVTLEDAGVYLCKGVNGFGSQTARMRLMVLEPSTTDSDDGLDTGKSGKRRADPSRGAGVKSIPMLSHETLEQIGPMHLSSGNTIRLKCESKDVPAKITWMKDGKSVGEKMWKWSSWTLVLSKVASEDTGVYTCVANNSMGKQEFSISIRVTDMVEKQKPELASGYPNNTSVLSGNEAILECVVHAGHSVMPPHIKWLKRVPENMEGIAANNRHKHRLLSLDKQHLLVIQETEDDTIRINETQRNGSYVSKLIFARPEADDEGIYICLATNNIGFNYKEARLTVLAGPPVMSVSAFIPSFPVILVGMSLIVAVVVIGTACSLKRHQEPKQTKTISSRQLSTPSINYSSSTSMYRKQGLEQRQLLVSTSTHSSSSSSGTGTGLESHQLHGVGVGTNHSGTVLCHSNYATKPGGVSMTTMSRCSCCSEKAEIAALHTYEPCFNGSYIGSSSHSNYCGHWT